MPISLLRITDFRNLASVDLDPSENGLNVICGLNGSGKTSLLEAIHYLGVGRSFRSSLSSRLIRREKEKFSLFAQIVSENQSTMPIGVERELNGASRLRVAEKDVANIAELACFLPIRVINSQSHHLFESGPVFRRKYLDWGLFYQNESFLSCWRHFERALKQRNAVLKDRRSKQELDTWTNELVKYGLEFDRLRIEYIQKLTPLVEQMAQELLSVTHLEINYQSGWDKHQEYTAVLTAAYPDDFRSGHTQFGPHRADFDVTIDHIPVKHFLSRGQQKLLICAMMLAQGALLAEHANKGLIYLVDDLPSELDFHSKAKLISLLTKQSAQVFITAIERAEVCSFVEKTNVPMKVFHVEHGTVKA